MKTAVVFAYHNVGVRCLKTLLSFGIDVLLVVTHNDNKNENIWFDSVEETAINYNITTIKPEDPNTQDIKDKIKKISPDFIFSFYYRNMLHNQLLEIAKIGAFNMHGSLLPYYRGRVPINWAIINGETKTGATLHKMSIKPDEGPIVNQMAVPILADDTALDVFNKVCVAAEMVLLESLPILCSGVVKLIPQDKNIVSYFYGRKAEDGLIPENLNAYEIHNFVRALTHPYPGAFTKKNGKYIHIWKTNLIDKLIKTTLNNHQLILDNNRCYLNAKSGGVLDVLEISVNNEAVTPIELANIFKCSTLIFDNQ